MTDAQEDLVGFATVAAAHPGRVAVIEPDGTSMTYGELAGRVNQLSHAFTAMGLRPGQTVAAMLPNSRTYFELRLATGQSGLYFTPISHHMKAPEVAYLLADSEAQVFVVDGSLVEVAGPALDAVDFPAQRRFVVGGPSSSYERLFASFPTSAPEEPLAGDFMGYTSGTTGRPKAVRKPLTGGPPQVSDYVRRYMERLGIFPGREVHLVGAPLYHSAPGTYAYFAMTFGHTVVIAERPKPEQLLQLIDQYRVSITVTVPTVLHRLLRLDDHIREKYDLSSLRSMVHGAAPCPVDVKRRAIEWLGPILYEYYGATEGSATVVSATEWLTKPGSVGYPLPSVKLRILDELGEPLPPGEVGTVYYTPAVPFEYFKAEDKTASAMRNGYFTAGDVGYLDEDGWLFLCDRRTDLILSGGVNLYPAEIEAALLEHPEVADAAVIGVPDDEWGQRAVAVVQPRSTVEPCAELAERLTAHCRSMLAGFKVPRTIEFTSSLPRTDVGKLLRREVRARYLGS